MPIVFDLVTERGSMWTPSKLTETRDEFHRQKMMIHLGYKKGSKVTCMVTGISGNDNQVICAHLLPLKAPLRRLEQELGISPEDLHGPKNCVFWSTGLEGAYEALQVSYVKSNPLEDSLRLKIWDDSVKEKPIFVGSPHKIGEYEGHMLNLGEHIVMKRALSFQAYQAYLVWKPNEELVREICNYGSPGLYKFKKKLELMRTGYFKDVDNEVGDMEEGSSDEEEEVGDIEEEPSDGGNT